jgi:hypothetical protein
MEIEGGNGNAASHADGADEPCEAEIGVFWVSIAMRAG